MKAADDEPLFVLRAKDPLAVELVRWWANQAVQTGTHESEKAAQAHVIADAMQEWRIRWIRSQQKGGGHAS